MAFAAKFDPEIPQELRALPPRMVQRRKVGAAHSAAGYWAIGLLFGGIGISMLVFFVGEPIFLLVANTVDARITSRDVYRGKSTTYKIRYTYSLSQRNLEGSDSVSSSVFAHLGIGQ